MPDILSVRYFPTDVPYRDPDDPGLEAPPEGRPYEIVTALSNGYTACEYVRPDRRPAAGPQGIEAAAVARGFAGAHEALYCHEARAWFVWDGSLWRRDRDGAVPRAIEALARAAITDATRGVAPPIGPARLATAAELCARQDLPATAWDADPMRLGTPGGTVDLATGVLRPAEPGDRITRATAVTPAPEADCPLWRRFLDEAMGGDAALVAFLRRFLGYALTGQTSEHVLVFGHGDGGNGKTVFANVVRGLFGDYAAAAAPDILAHRGGAQAARAHSAELAMLAGARLVTAAETEQGQPLAEARLKLLTGGDPITARFMNRDFFTFTPRFKLIVMGNHMPVLRAVDAAIERRLCLVPFATRPARPDRDLEARLMDEGPGILRWMIEGCLAWRAEGLGRPERVRAATAAYLMGQDVVGSFLHEACEMGPTHVETAAALYAAWVAYAKAAGEAPGSRRGLAFALERRGLARERSRHARLHRGLRLLTAEERAEDPRLEAGTVTLGDA